MLHKEVFGNATLYLADCRDVLSTLESVDAVVTDPPYGINYGKMGGNNSGGWSGLRISSDWDKIRPSKEIFDLIKQISKYQIIWGGNYFTDYLPPSSKWLIWDKGQTNFSLGDAELAWCSFRGAIRRINYSRSKALQDKKKHPTQKALVVMLWTINQLPPPINTIFDPFMGSGTTGVAAIRLGKKFIGVEVNEKYFAIACKRMSKVQPFLFDNPFITVNKYSIL